MKTTKLIASLLSVLILLTFTSAVLAQAAPATPAATPAATAAPAGTATPAATPAATAAPATTPAATAPALVPAGTAAPTAAGDKTATTNEAAKTGDTKTDKKTGEGEEEVVVEETFFQKYFMFIMLGGFVLLWMFMSRGRKKREAQRREMLNELKKGDKVVTIGGICGTIIETTETEITLKVGENNRMKMARWAIRMAGQEAQDDKKNDSQADAR